MHSNGDAYYVLQQYNYGGCMYTACSLIMMCHYDWGIVGKKWGYGKIHQQHKTQSLNTVLIELNSLLVHACCAMYIIIIVLD